MKGPIYGQYGQTVVENLRKKDRYERFQRFKEGFLNVASAGIIGILTIGGAFGVYKLASTGANITQKGIGKLEHKLSSVLTPKFFVDENGQRKVKYGSHVYCYNEPTGNSVWAETAKVSGDDPNAKDLAEKAEKMGKRIIPFECK